MQLQMRDIRPLETLNTVGTEAPPSFPLSDRAKALKVLLLEPLFPAEAAWGSAKTEQGYLPPMGTVSVYRWLTERGYQVELLDTQFGDYNPERLTAYLCDHAFDVVALSVYTPTADYAFATGTLVKEALPHCVVVMGNIHVTTLPQLSMEQCPAIDFIIRHEAEFTMDEFLSALADGNHDWSKIPGLVYKDGERIVVNPQRPFIGTLDNLPVGYYGDLALDRYVPHATQYVVLPNYPFLTQRGCPYPCSYCEASLILGKKARYYSPERVIDELKILKHDKRARGVYFQDSTFTMNRKFVVELMRLMVAEKLDLLWSCNTRADRVDPELLDMMYAAGGRQIILGIESGNQRSLDLIQKATTVEKQTQGVEWIRKAGFRYMSSFIICLPGETPEMVQHTIDYAKRLSSHTSMFYLPVPYPGSKLYESCKADGGIRRTASWSDFIAIDFDNPVYVNPNFGADGMRNWYKKAYIQYYRSPGVWMTNLRAVRTTEDVKRLARGGRAITSMVGHGLWSFLKHEYRGFHGQAAPISPD